LSQFLAALPSWGPAPHNLLDDHYAKWGRERRFAGDHTLPRCRYYTLCGASGEDHGTLLYELLAYSSGSHAHPFIIREVDLGIEEMPANIAQYERPPAGRAIRVTFPMLRAEAHPYISDKGLQSATEGVAVYLPLNVVKLNVDGVLDLRDPAAGDWFAAHCSTIGAKCWPLRPPISTFRDVLPSLFTLRLGGDDFTKNVGLSLREFGVKGLIYPSTRMDCGVIVEHGVVVEWAGWHLVDFRGSGQPDGRLRFLSEDDFWPAHAGLTNPLGTLTPGPRISYSDIYFHHTPEGHLRGSWKVEGLSRYTTARLGGAPRFKEFGSESV